MSKVLDKYWCNECNKYHKSGYKVHYKYKSKHAKKKPIEFDPTLTITKPDPMKQSSKYDNLVEFPVMQLIMNGYMMKKDGFLRNMDISKAPIYSHIMKRVLESYHLLTDKEREIVIKFKTEILK